jgi:hypothetical protein
MSTGSLGGFERAILPKRLQDRLEPLKPRALARRRNPARSEVQVDFRRGASATVVIHLLAKFCHSDWCVPTLGAGVEEPAVAF